jgi:hypothetical protein
MNLIGECEQDLAVSVIGKWRNSVNTVINVEVAQNARNFRPSCVAFVVSGVRAMQCSGQFSRPSDRSQLQPCCKRTAL